VLCHTTAMSDAGDENEDAQLNSFFGTILESGSSFNPAFLLVVDGTFAFLFIVLTSLMVLTRGNIHLIFLTFIEVALWASVKWFVHEWNLTQSNNNPPFDESKSKKD